MADQAVSTKTQAGILADPASCSLKRAAWAYGCARKGSPEEAALLEIVLLKARQEVRHGHR